MDMHDYFRPRFLPKVEELNKNLRNLFIQYSKKSFELVPKSDAARFNNIEYNNRNFIYVDLNNNNNSDFSLLGYFSFGGVIHRFLKIIFDYCSLFPINNYPYSNTLFCNGINLDDLNQNIRLSNSLRLMFLRKGSVGKYYVYDADETPLYNKYIYKSSLKTCDSDDLGELFYSFDGIEGLSINELPQPFLDNEYSLVGINHYAPLTAKDAYCVLFAEDNNPYDKNAIKVLRWHPQSKSSPKQFSWGDYFFELGYISRNDNEELHDYMMQSHSRILFGTKDANKIKLLGGISIFFDNEFYYPKCLSQIPIL